MQALSQLSYGPTLMLRAAYNIGVFRKGKHFFRRIQKTPALPGFFAFDWRPHGDSNPGRHRERVMS